MVLHGEKVNYEKEMDYRSRHEVSISHLTEEELSCLSTMDEYAAESEIFRVFDYDINHLGSTVECAEFFLWKIVQYS